MANAWKADLTVARLVLSESIGRFAAELCGWRGSRLRQDTIWWKAPKTKPIAYHQDTWFIDFLEPPSTLTCWVTLDDTHRDAGTLEYAPGSHEEMAADAVAGHVSRGRRLSGADEGLPPKLPASNRPIRFSSKCRPDLRVPLQQRGAAMPPMSTPTECAAQSVFTCCPRTSAWRRAGGYMYRRYGSPAGNPATMKSYFPVLWSRWAPNTKMIKSLSESGLRHAEWRNWMCDSNADNALCQKRRRFTWLLRSSAAGRLMWS